MPLSAFITPNLTSTPRTRTLWPSVTGDSFLQPGGQLQCLLRHEARPNPGHYPAFNAEFDHLWRIHVSVSLAPDPSTLVSSPLAGKDRSTQRRSAEPAAAPTSL